jgi:16S rRNA processing protein RimM
MSQQYFHIGKIVASFGLKGELILEHSLGKSTGFKTLEVIFVENRKDSFLPYFVEEAKAKGPSEAYLKLEGVDTKEAARLLNQKEIWKKTLRGWRQRPHQSPCWGIHFSMERKNLGKSRK